MESLPGFQELFGRPATVHAGAPGRVNLIGEHTDYNGGYVLPTVIPQRTRIDLALRDDRLVRAWSANMPPAERSYEYALGGERPERAWIDYVAGITAGLSALGHELRGFDVRIESEVPVGGGVSSSAALEIGVATAVVAALGLQIAGVELAKLGRWAENDFVGAPTGIMDQMVVALGEPGSAFFLDTRTLHYEQVRIPDRVELAVIDSGIRHRHSTGEYAKRHAQCEEASRRLGVAELRDVTARDFARFDLLPEPLGRRARHVVTENERVLQAVDAMRRGDTARLGALLVESHASMRDDFNVSIPEIDTLVDLAVADPDILGARMTGGGFGGAVVMLSKSGRAAAASARVVDRYAAVTGQAPTVLVPRGR